MHGIGAPPYYLNKGPYRRSLKKTTKLRSKKATKATTTTKKHTKKEKAEKIAKQVVTQHKHVLDPLLPGANKIKDNQLPTSHVYSYKFVEEFSVSAGTNGYVLLFPQLGKFCHTLNTGSVTKHYGSDNGLYVPTSAYSKTAEDSNRFDRLGDIEKWRLVSQGCRLVLTNTNEENDGWWEATRFNGNLDSTQMGIRAINDGEYSLVPEAAWINTVGKANINANMQSHTADSVKNLHSYKFINNFIGGADRHIQKAMVDYRLDASAESSDYASFPNDRNVQQNQEFVDDMIAGDYDIILINIHAGTHDLKFLLEGKQNLEVQYATSSINPSSMTSMETSNAMTPDQVESHDDLRRGLMMVDNHMKQHHKAGREMVHYLEAAAGSAAAMYNSPLGQDLIKMLMASL